MLVSASSLLHRATYKKKRFVSTEARANLKAEMSHTSDRRGLRPAPQQALWVVRRMRPLCQISRLLATFFLNFAWPCQ
jgi:hypothetical protein